MFDLQPFTPLAVGETDWRAFDFTKDLGSEGALNPRVVCTWFVGAPGSDPSPQNQVGQTKIVGSLEILVGPQNTPVTKTGVFIMFYLGPPPLSAAGGAYLIQALVDTATRTGLSQSARQPISAT